MESNEGKDEAVRFYDNIETYHKKVNKIFQLIVDYFNKKGKVYNPNYVAIRLHEHKIIETNAELTDLEKQKIENWSYNTENSKLDSEIYKIELKDKILFCKIFNFEDDNLVIAGYSLKETISVRLFISSFSEKRMREKYEKILSII